MRRHFEQFLEPIERSGESLLISTGCFYWLICAQANGRSKEKVVP